MAGWIAVCAFPLVGAGLALPLYSVRGWGGERMGAGACPAPAVSRRPGRWRTCDRRGWARPAPHSPPPPARTNCEGRASPAPTRVRSSCS